jgi:hypothetical protein
MEIRKQQSHGRIGEAAVVAKCWMHGIPAYNTAGISTKRLAPSMRTPANSIFSI